MMIVARSLSGALNGNVAVIKASLGDITDESNSTEAFALYGLTWTVGIDHWVSMRHRTLLILLSNSIGGLFSHPYERMPSVFGGITLFQTFPYLLRE